VYTCRTKFLESFILQKWKDFNGNGYLQGVRHVAPYCDHFGLLCRQFESKMTAKIQKSSDLGEIWYYYRHDRVKNWALIISCYVLTLFFIHTTSTCIVRLGDICNALRYSNQYFYMFLYFYSFCKPKWSQYGAACLTPCKYPFPLKSFHLWIFNDFLNFYIGGHFEI
jgi:hypothetical protein